MEVNMKNNKWVGRTLAILLTLVVLVGVGGAGFRMGVMQGANISQNADGKAPFFGHGTRFDGNFNNQQGDSKERGFNHPQMRGFDHGFNRGMGRGGFSPLFGLIHLVVLGLLLWAGYKLYQKSGWQFVKVNTPETPPVDEKKD